MDPIKEHFEKEASEFDGIIQKLIPFYNQMIKALVDSIYFETDKAIRVIDLGCGTGTISLQISEKFSNAEIVCLDLAANMIEISKQKLAHHDNKEFITGDFSAVNGLKPFDVVVSSLALHHLETDIDKFSYYEKIYNLLSPGGIFFNADITLGSTDFLQQVYMQRWIEFMNRAVSTEEILNKWIPTYEAEDRPARLIDQLNWLKKIGFKEVDVIWKYYNFSVYGGLK